MGKALFRPAFLAAGGNEPMVRMNDKAEKPERSVATSLRKALAILEQVADADGPLTGQQIAVESAAMQKVLERHVRAHLDELAEVRPDFR